MHLRSAKFPMGLPDLCPRDAASLLSTAGACEVLYDACVWGGSRKKAQRLRTNMAALRALGVSCDGNHPHLLWRQRTSCATKHEAEYAEVLCMKVADLLADVQGRDCDYEHAVSPLAAAAADSVPCPTSCAGTQGQTESSHGIPAESWEVCRSGL